MIEKPSRNSLTDCVPLSATCRLCSTGAAIVGHVLELDRSLNSLINHRTKWIIIIHSYLASNTLNIFNERLFVFQESIEEQVVPRARPQRKSRSKGRTTSSGPRLKCPLFKNCCPFRNRSSYFSKSTRNAGVDARGDGTQYARNI